MSQPSIGAQASRLARDLTLNSPSATKTTIPKLVYGTAWKKDKTESLVYEALKNGFRGIDTAAQPKHYDEIGVGKGIRRALADGIIKREDLFVQTKFTSPSGQSEDAPYNQDLPIADMVHMSLKSSLRNLFDHPPQSAYIDSVVMHSPLRTMEDTLTAWRTMEKYVPENVRNLGISNVTLPVLKTLCQEVSIKPAVVQNRFHAETGYEVELREFCKANDIVFQSFWTFTANPRLARSQIIAQVAEQAGVQPVAAYYALVLGLEGVTVLDGTSNAEHMREDLEGIEKVGVWAEGGGKGSWEDVMKEFKAIIGES